MFNRFFNTLCQFTGVLIILGLMGTNVFFLAGLNGRMDRINKTIEIEIQILESINTHRSV